MTAALTEPGTGHGRSTGRAARLRWAVPSTWPTYWPLAALLWGYPLWWIAGVQAVMPFLLAEPMVLQLLRHRPVLLPSGFRWWALFLVWLTASGLMLWVDAPTGVPGGGTSRLLVYGHRYAWYLTCTVILLWICNLDEREVPSSKVVRLFGWMFVVTAVGGLLGVFAAEIQITSLVELVLPRGITSEPYIASLVKPQFATIAGILGQDAPRPLAPFEYANSWGSNLSMYLPFFLVGWCGRSNGWRRIPAIALLAAAVVPVVASLNRGLWASLVLGLVFVVVRLGLRGRVVALIGTVVAVAIGAALFLGSELGDTSVQRIDTPHSNERRGELLAATVSDTVTTSPVVGFGSTRDVQGSFASIAGGGTPECPLCRVPPLGTQGQLWFVIFSQGFLGALFFCGFYVQQLLRGIRSRTTLETVGVAVLLFLLLQLLIYDVLGMPLYTVMAAVGLMWREQHLRAGTGRADTLQRLVGQVVDGRHRILAAVLVGLSLGVLVSFVRDDTYTATSAILLTPAPVHLDLTGEAPPRDITIDTEAAMVFSEQAVQRVRTRALAESGDDITADELRDRIRVSAVPNTRTLLVGVTDADPGRAERLSEALQEAYLEVRAEHLTQRRNQVVWELRQQLNSIAGSGLPAVSVVSEEDEPIPVPVSGLLEDQLREAIDAIVLTPAAAGEVVRTPTAVRDRRQTEVPIVSGALLGLLAGLAWAGASAAGPSSGRPQIPRPRR